MLNAKLISKIFGSLLLLEASLMSWCLFMAIYYKGQDTYSFFISILITVICGVTLRILGRNADNNMSRRDAYFVVTVAWVMFSQ